MPVSLASASESNNIVDLAAARLRHRRADSAATSPATQIGLQEAPFVLRYPVFYVFPVWPLPYGDTAGS